MYSAIPCRIVDFLNCRTQKSSYPLAIPCRFVDFSTQKSTYPYAKHCRYSSLSQKLLVGADYMYSAIPCRFVDFLKSRTQKSYYPLAIPCRFVDFSTQKSTYPYAKHCRYSSLSQKLLVGADYMYSAIPCRFVDFLNSIQNQKIFLSIGNSLQICRFFKYVQKSTYPFAKHCSFSHL